MNSVNISGGTFNYCSIGFQSKALSNESPSRFVSLGGKYLMWECSTGNDISSALDRLAQEMLSEGASYCDFKEAAKEEIWFGQTGIEAHLKWSKTRNKWQPCTRFNRLVHATWFHWKPQYESAEEVEEKDSDFHLPQTED